jgi:hypothetical protein
MLKIAEVKLSSCGLEVADFRKNCHCGVAVEEQLRSNISFKSSGIAIADSKQSCACPPVGKG